MIEVKYFARFREELGSAGEQIEASGVDTIDTLLCELRDRGGAWSRLFAEDQRVMMAVKAGAL